MDKKDEQQVRDTLILLLGEREDYALSLRERLHKRGLLIGYQIYPILHEMEREGIIIAEERKEDMGNRHGHPRWYYKLAKTETKT